MFEKYPNNGMNLIFLNLLETFDKNQNLYIESLRNSKKLYGRKVKVITNQILFGKYVLEEITDFYITRYKKYIEKIKDLSENIESSDNNINDLETFLQFDFTGENIKLFNLNNIIQEETNLIQNMKNSECFKRLITSAEYMRMIINSKNDLNKLDQNQIEKNLGICGDKVPYDKMFYEQICLKYSKNDEKNIFLNEDLCNNQNKENGKEEFKMNLSNKTSPHKIKKKFPPFIQKQIKIIPVNDYDSNYKLEKLITNDNIFNTEIIKNIEDFGKNINKSKKLLNNKKFRDDSLIKNSKGSLKKNKSEKVRLLTEEEMRNKIKVLSESSKNPTVNLYFIINIFKTFY